MADTPEIVIIGGGIGGGAAATVLARQGLSVAVLERDISPVDRVHGEFMAPWGVTMADRLGVLDILHEAARGFYVPIVIGYDEDVAPEQAEASARDLRAVHPIGTGPLCAGHPPCVRPYARHSEPSLARLPRPGGPAHFAASL
jgi:menaquinone-9 beta-reductase